MKIILVHWLIKKGKENKFLKNWEKMKVETGKGLYREIMTTVDSTLQDEKFHTFHLESPAYTTFINIGIWKSVSDFNKAIGKYIPKPKRVKGKYTIELNDFEFKLRERIVLKKIKDRGIDLPKADLRE